MTQKEKTIYANQQKKTDLDCTVCKKQKGCASRAEGKFCDGFISETFKPWKRKPLTAWEQERKARQEVME